MAQPPPQVLDLIQRFDRNRDAYRSPHYNETQLRREFLDPLFKALGWDMDNEQGYAEAYKDVIHEDAIKVGEATKAPDYCFRIGGTRKFFLEAKRPSVDIKNDVSPAYQLRRYGWTTKLPLSILSDFEEFAVYDCRVKPDHKHSAAIGRILYIPYADYARRWDEIAGIFSRDAVLKGAFDKFADSTRAKGTADVDDEFLKTIETWRADLARNLALRNPKLSQRELNFAVQRIIDRIIFLRIGEGRGIEDYGRLRALANGDRIYPRLAQLFEEADTRYNSGLFHFKPEKGRHEAPDELTLALDIDDKLLRDIIKGLYYPESPYVFSALPADILGQVYEQFLGKVIRLTEGHRAVVEEKPEVKKAGGVYYTPTYIVDYIVQATVGHLLEGKTPRQAARLKILDPACGSGSFLIGAYEHLLKWHRDFYTKDNPEKWAKGAKPVLVQVGPGKWRLTIAERKRILLDNIYGVDIDTQAVETTKLSLLLKVLEGETQQTLQPVLRLFHERALPDLGDNIKCGNSLIGPDFYQQQQMPLLDEDERYRVNVFDWAAEFPDIFKAGGFDAVVGNPPYVLGRETFNSGTKAYLASHYKSFGGKYDLYVYFADKAVSLLAMHGRLGFILPNTLLANENAANLRKLLAEETCIKIIRTFTNRVFKRAQVESIVIVVEKGPPNPATAVRIESEATSEVLQSSFTTTTDFRFAIVTDPKAEALLGKIRSHATPLGSLCDICIGIQLGGSSGTRTKQSFLDASRADGTWKPVLDGKDINRYRKAWPGVYVKYGNWLHRKRDERYFVNEKLVIRQIGQTPIATLDVEGLYTLNTIYNVINASDYSLHYILGVVNSKLGRWFWIKANSDFKTLFPKIKKAQLESIPIRSIAFKQATEKSRHDEMVKLVGQMLDLHARLTAARTPQEKTALERQIAATDTQLDKLVYALYGLTDAEIKIVEGSTP